MNRKDYINEIKEKVTRPIYFQPSVCYAMNEEAIPNGEYMKIIGVEPDKGQICVISSDKWLVPLEEMTYNELGMLCKALRKHFSYVPQN